LGRQEQLLPLGILRTLESYFSFIFSTNIPQAKLLTYIG